MKYSQALWFICIVFLLGCNNSDQKNMATITIDSINGLMINSESILTLKIWGFDANIADQSATLLFNQSKNITRIPDTWEISIDENWSNNINPNSGPKSEYRYYISLESNQFQTDFKNTNNGNGPKISTNLNSLNQTIYIEKLNEAP